MSEEVEKIMFSATMTKFNVNVKKENIFTCFSLQVVEDTSVRSFPRQFKTINLDVFDHMAHNDVFDKINIPCADYMVEWDMAFGETEFTAKLENISANVKRTKDGTPYTVYNLNFIKEIDKDIDVKLSCYLKQKEEDETGKKKPKLFNTVMIAK